MWPCPYAIVAVLLFLVPSPTRPQAIGTYTFEDDAFVPSLTAPGVHFAEVTLEQGDAAESIDPSFLRGFASEQALGSPMWPLTIDDGSGPAFEFTVAPFGNRKVSLLDLSFQQRRSPTGPRRWQLRGSHDDFGVVLDEGLLPDSNAWHTERVALNFGAFVNFTEPLTFRLGADAAERTTGVWRVDNLQLTGDTETIPALVVYDFEGDAVAGRSSFPTRTIVGPFSYEDGTGEVSPDANTTTTTTTTTTTATMTTVTTTTTTTATTTTSTTTTTVTTTTVTTTTTTTNSATTTTTTSATTTTTTSTTSTTATSTTSTTSTSTTTTTTTTTATTTTTTTATTTTTTTATTTTTTTATTATTTTTTTVTTTTTTTDSASTTTSTSFTTTTTTTTTATTITTTTATTTTSTTATTTTTTTTTTSTAAPAPTLVDPSFLSGVGFPSTQSIGAPNWPVGNATTTVNGTVPRFAFAIQPAPGAVLVPTALTFQQKRSLTGPRRWELRTSLDNFTTVLASQTLPDDDAWSSEHVALSPALFSRSAPLVDPVTFHLRGLGAEKPTGVWRIDDVTVLGSALLAPATITTTTATSNATATSTALSPSTTFTSTSTTLTTTSTATTTTTTTSTTTTTATSSATSSTTTTFTSATETTTTSSTTFTSTTDFSLSRSKADNTDMLVLISFLAALFLLGCCLLLFPVFRDLLFGFQQIRQEKIIEDRSLPPMTEPKAVVFPEHDYVFDEAPKAVAAGAMSYDSVSVEDWYDDRSGNESLDVDFWNVESASPGRAAMVPYSAPAPAPYLQPVPMPVQAYAVQPRAPHRYKYRRAAPTVPPAGYGYDTQPAPQPYPPQPYPSQYGYAAGFGGGYQNAGYQNAGYQNAGYQNAGYSTSPQAPRYGDGSNGYPPQQAAMPDQSYTTLDWDYAL